MVGANYHGIVTTDVLVEGLSRRAIATRNLKGVNRDKGHERFYTSSAPYDEGKSLRLVVLVLLGFRSPTCFTRRLAYRSLVSCPKPPPGRPLI